MKSNNPVESQKIKHARNVFEQYPVDLVYFFGSRLHQSDLHGESDFDFAVLFSEDCPVDRRTTLRGEMMDQLFSIFGKDNVDIIDLERVPLSLRFQAIQPCEVILCANEPRRVHFETKTTREFHDVKPSLDRELKHLAGSVGRT